MRIRSETAALLAVLRACPGSLQLTEVAEQMGYSMQNARKRLTALAGARMVLREVMRSGVITWRVTSTGEAALRQWEFLREPKAGVVRPPRGLLNSVWALGEHR